MQSNDVAQERLRAAAAAWWLLVVVGVASLVAGVILVLRPSNSLATLAVVFGIFMLIDGIVELFRSLGHEVANRALAAIVGLLGVIVGIVLIRHPFHGVAAIGLLIGLWLVAAGVIRLVRAVVASARPLLQAAIAVFEVIVGIVIVSDPKIGYTALAVITGICLIVNGAMYILLGFAVRGADTDLAPTSRPAARA